MEIELSALSDTAVWHAAQDGNAAAAAELRKREARVRGEALSPETRALMAARIRNGSPRG